MEKAPGHRALLKRVHSGLCSTNRPVDRRVVGRSFSKHRHRYESVGQHCAHRAYVCTHRHELRSLSRLLRPTKARSIAVSTVTINSARQSFLTAWIFFFSISYPSLIKSRLTTRTLHSCLVKQCHPSNNINAQVSNLK